jgi:hypothetical protein
VASKDRDAASAGQLFLPAQWGTMGTQASRVLALMARARSSREHVRFSDLDIRDPNIVDGFVEATLICTLPGAILA